MSNESIPKDHYLEIDAAELAAKYGAIQKGRQDDTLAPTFLKTVCVSGSAALKILEHAQQGILQGVEQSGMPLEVMGMLAGHLLCGEGGMETLVVTDAFPVPAKGGAHAVQEDPRTGAYMLHLADDIARLQAGDQLCGWYHSHPFDPNEQETGHLWFSDTDVQNQAGWQYMFETQAGVPFVGLVVDPLNSFHRGQLMLAAFRNYPPSHEAPRAAGLCPDGAVERDETRRHALWGQAWGAYYRLRLELYATSMMARVMGIMQQDAMWSAVLSQSKLLAPSFPTLLAPRVDKLAADARASSRQALTAHAAALAQRQSNPHHPHHALHPHHAHLLSAPGRHLPPHLAAAAAAQRHPALFGHRRRGGASFSTSSSSSSSSAAFAFSLAPLEQHEAQELPLDQEQLLGEQLMLLQQQQQHLQYSDGDEEDELQSPYFPSSSPSAPSTTTTLSSTTLSSTLSSTLSTTLSSTLSSTSTTPSSNAKPSNGPPASSTVKSSASNPTHVEQAASFIAFDFLYAQLTQHAKYHIFH